MPSFVFGKSESRHYVQKIIGATKVKPSPLMKKAVEHSIEVSVEVKKVRLNTPIRISKTQIRTLTFI